MASVQDQIDAWTVIKDNIENNTQEENEEIQREFPDQMEFEGNGDMIIVKWKGSEVE